MKRFFFSAFIVSLVTVAFGQRNLGPDATPVHRDIQTSRSTVFSQSPNLANGIFSDSGCATCSSGQQALAENFNLGADTAITNIVIWGGYHPDNIPSTDVFSVIITSDTGGNRDPGAVVWSAGSLSASRTATGGTLFGVDEYRYEITLNTPVIPSGSYWIEVTNDTTGNTDDFFWESGDLDGANGIPGSVWSTSVPGSNWNTDPNTDLSLMINVGGVAADDVPTMSTWGLIIFSLSLIIAVIAIKRRN